MYTENDTPLTNRATIQQELVGLYENLQGTCSTELPDIDLLTGRGGSIMSPEAKEMLSQPISVQEIDKALLMTLSLLE